MLISDLFVRQPPRSVLRSFGVPDAVSSRPGILTRFQGNTNLAHPQGTVGESHRLDDLSFKFKLVE